MKYLGVILVGVVLLLLFIGPRSASTPRTSTASAQRKAAASCRVEAQDASGRAAAKNWCDTGLYSRVTLNTDATTLVALLVFNDAGMRGWERNREKILLSLRDTVTNIGDLTGMKVALSVFDPSEKMIGGCAGNAKSRPVCR